MAGTSWTDFIAGTKLKASQINNNFDWLEGALMPQIAGSTFHNTYDLGSDTYRWKELHVGTSIVLAGNTITSGIVDGVTMGLANNSLGIATQGIRGSTANAGGTQQEVAQGTLSTPDFRQNSVYRISGSNSGATSSSSGITNVVITTIGSGMMLVYGHATIHLTNGVGNAAVEISIDRGGTKINGGWARAVIQPSQSNFTTTCALFVMFTETLSPGTYTYNLNYQIIAGSLTALEAHNLVAVELRK